MNTDVTLESAVSVPARPFPGNVTFPHVLADRPTVPRERFHGVIGDRCGNTPSAASDVVR